MIYLYRKGRGESVDSERRESSYLWDSCAGGPHVLLYQCPQLLLPMQTVNPVRAVVVEMVLGCVVRLDGIQNGQISRRRLEVQYYFRSAVLCWSNCMVVPDSYWILRNYRGVHIPSFKKYQGRNPGQLDLIMYEYLKTVSYGLGLKAARRGLCETTFE